MDARMTVAAVLLLAGALPAAGQVGNANENVEAVSPVSECAPGTPVPAPNAEGNIESTCWPRPEVETRGEIHMHIE